MPTRGRAEMALRALSSFFAQTYTRKELVVLDDPACPSFPEGIDEAGVRYFREPGRDIATKRNRCCELAHGDVIAHWDSDDWSAPERLAVQVARLEQSGKAVTGLTNMLFHAEPDKAYRYFNQNPLYVLGTSLCYQREFWQAHPFPRSGKAWGEDNAFREMAEREKQLDACPAGKLMVATIHPDNTSQRSVSAWMTWRPVPLPEIPKEFFVSTPPAEVCR